MTDKHEIILSSQQARLFAKLCIEQAPEGYAVIIQEMTRTIEQNAAQWPILQSFSEQLLWPVNDRMVKMSAEEWKDVLTAAFHKEKLRLAQGLDGGVVMLGLRTSKFGKKEFGEWLEFVNYIAAERGVKIIDRRYGDAFEAYRARWEV